MDAFTGALDRVAAAVEEGPEAAGLIAAPQGWPLDGLDLFAHERQLLFWALAGIYRRGVAEAFGRWSGAGGPRALTYGVLSRLAGLALERCEGQWSSALQRSGRLLRLGLLTLDGDAILPSVALRARIAREDALPDGWQDAVSVADGSAPAPILGAQASARLEALRAQWAQADAPPPLTYLIGPVGGGRTLCALWIARARHKGLLVVEGSRWPEALHVLALAREARWRRCCVLLRLEAEALDGPWRGRIGHLLAEGVEVLVSMPAGGEPESFRERAVSWLELPPYGAAERRALWARYLPQRRRVQGLSDEVLAFRFRGQPATIAALASQALDLARLTTDRVSLDHLHEAARCTMSRGLAKLATLEPLLPQGLAAVVLPPADVAQLQELLWRVRHRQQVMEGWGFARTLHSGLGTVALLSGPPGTGKTLSARAVASELGVALYRIDLSQVVSKWVGETEKHLGALFAEAEASGAALLFDEADALFAKRTEVRSSNDRYANLEVGYLLQRIEAFTGLCFLTTNMDRSMDEAFLRRMALHMRFALPSAREREAIWRGALPEAAPLASDVSLEALAARFELSGGAIRNAALRAAFRAAHAQTPITQADLIASAERERAASGLLTRHTH